MVSNRSYRLLKLIPKIVLLGLCTTILVSCSYPIFIQSNSADQSNVSNLPVSESEIEENKTVDDDQMIWEEDIEPLCEGPERMTVLVAGIDAHEQADAIRMVSVDFVSGEVNVVAIPRDFYVDVVGFEDHNIHKGRINATFGYGEKYSGLGNGIIALEENLAFNFGVEFDRFVVLNFDDVADYIDEVGGVDVFLERSESDDKFYFSRGFHHFDGETAVNFMRMRRYDDDFHRINRQTMLLKVFYTRVMDELEPMQQMHLALKGLFDPNIKTNFVYDDISPLICLARMLEDEDVDFIEIPKVMYHSATTSSGGAVQIPHDTVLPFIQSVMEGTFQSEFSESVED